MLTVVRPDEMLIVLDFGQREWERRNFSFAEMWRLEYWKVDAGPHGGCAALIPRLFQRETLYCQT